MDPATCSMRDGVALPLFQADGHSCLPKEGFLGNHLDWVTLATDP